MEVSSHSSSDGFCSCWYRKTKAERWFIIWALCVVVIGVAIIIAVFLMSRISEGCSTNRCFFVASYIRDRMDQKVDPCKDFYLFSCGNYFREAGFLETNSAVFVDDFSRIARSVSETSIEILNEKREGDTEALRKAKDFYYSCLSKNISELYRIGRFMLEQIQQWPALNANWTAEDFDLVDTLVAVRKWGPSPLIGLHSQIINRTSRILIVTEPSLYPNRPSLFQGPRDGKDLQEYEASIQGNLTRLEARRKSINSDSRDIVDFEIELVNIMTVNYNTNIIPLYITTLGELRGFDWDRYVTELMEWADLRVTVQEKIIFQNSSYFDKLFPLLQRTSNTTIANYIMWTVFRLYLLGPDLKDSKSLLPDIWSFVNKNVTDDMVKCAQITHHYLGHPVGKVAVTKLVSVLDKQAVDEMAENIKLALIEWINDATWIDEITKQLAKRKVIAMGKIIGFPEPFPDDVSINRLYANMTVTKDTYYENLQQCEKAWSWIYLNRLRTVANDSELISYSWLLQANAFYVHPRNQMIIPPGIMHDYLFHRTSPASVNYGKLGTIIGHEMIHGFDILGLGFDEYGNYKNWWTNESLSNFLFKARCFVEQYSNYTAYDVQLQLDGKKTLNENIADNGGLRQSFRAYRKYVTENPTKALTLRGLKYTSDQLFFIAFAQNYCRASNKAATKLLIEEDIHTLHNYRVIGSLQNSPDFSRAFSCYSGSYMNPVEKCSLW